MCGRIAQSETRRYYAKFLDPDLLPREWIGGDTAPQFNLSPGRTALLLHMLNGKLASDYVSWGYRTPNEAAAKRKPWINARVEKALTGRYFRHMFRQGRMIVPGGGWFEWTVEDGKKQPWYISRKTNEPIFMAGLTNFQPYAQQEVEVGFVIVTEDAEGGMVDIHDRRPVVLEPQDALRWMDLDTPVEEAAHIAQSRSVPSSQFQWWRVTRRVNRPDPATNDQHLLEPAEYEQR
ncbi:putative SOS response-associated peptidase YedK [Nitrosospira sp. Nsp2]|uniref:SOS response-associated peptidase n=1 Tax=Nitrosospira sp. Nsp2 TaxID=136548 RepID=UPI000D30A933|nr:SOS response-associated peptidase family protein [Nitrosospira sp. Nsp2]PTR14476.1 putative SOS response-associated peptidase YedK [Nitrosospira sp. Nsp2]